MGIARKSSGDGPLARLCCDEAVDRDGVPTYDCGFNFASGCTVIVDYFQAPDGDWVYSVEFEGGGMCTAAARRQARCRVGYRKSTTARPSTATTVHPLIQWGTAGVRTAGSG